MKKLKISSLYDNLHFLFILLILLILAIKHWYFIPVFIAYLFFIFKKTPLFYLGVCLSILVFFSNLKYLKTHNSNEFEGTVVECDAKKAIIRTDGFKVLVYHDEKLSLGDVGVFYVSNLNYDSDLFEYSEYLENNNISNYYKLEEFKFKKNRFVIAKIQDFFIKDLKEYKYINTLVFAYKDSDDSIYDASEKIGISHLLAVSGMHVSLLVLIIEFILKKLFYFENLIDGFVVLFLFIYLFLTNFELTVLRSVMMIIFSKVFKKLHFTTLDIFSLTGIIFLVLNPRYLFLMSFQLSFLVSFTIVIFGKNFKIENKIVQAYVIGIIAFLVTLPIILNANYEVNLLSIIFGPIYVLFFEFILYPITLILMVFPKLYFVLKYVYDLFESSIYMLSDINTFNIIFGKLNRFSFILYYVILFFLLVSFEIKRGRMLFCFSLLLFLSIIYNKAYLNPFYEVKAYDVGQGDSVLISLPFNQGNFLFDCYNNVDEYLKRDGIKDIDIVFLSHGHSDHIGSYEKIMKNFNVTNTYTSVYANSDMLNQYKKHYDIKTLKVNDILKYKNISFNIFGPMKDYKDENNNSLVIKGLFERFSILFTGDIEIEVENDLIMTYKNKLKSDILKVSHHGSNTSTKKEFLEYVEAKYYIICVGKNNFYGFPNNHNLKNKDNVFRTDKDGTIRLRF